MLPLRKILFFCSFLFLSFKVFGEDTLLIRKGDQDYYIKGSYLEILEDPHKNLTIKDVVSPLTSDRFYTNKENKFPYVVNTNSAYWIRFRIKADSMPEKNGCLRIWTCILTSLNFINLREIILKKK